MELTFEWKETGDKHITHKAFIDQGRLLNNVMGRSGRRSVEGAVLLTA